MGLECPWYPLRGRATNWDLEKLVRMVDRSHAKPKEGLSGAPSGYFYPPLEGRLLAPARWILWSAPAVVPRSVVPALCFAKDGAPVVQVGIERSKACTTRPKFKSPALSQKKKRDKDGAPQKQVPPLRRVIRFANRPAPVGMTEFIFGRAIFWAHFLRLKARIAERGLWEVEAKFKSPALSQKKKRDKDGAPAKAGPSTPQGDSLCESPCSGRDDRVYFRFANRPAPVGRTEFIFALRIALLRSGGQRCAGGLCCKTVGLQDSADGIGRREVGGGPDEDGVVFFQEAGVHEAGVHEIMVSKFGICEVGGGDLG